MRHAVSGTPVPTGSSRRHPAQVLAGLLSGAALVSAVLVSTAAPGARLFHTPAATPSTRALVHAALSDTTEGDSLLSDSTLADASPLDTVAFDSTVSDSADGDTSLSERYLPDFQRDRRAASLFQRRTRPLSARLGNYWRHEVSLDSTSGQYVVREKVGEEDVRYPVFLDRDAYREARLRDGMAENWSTLTGLREQQRQNQRRGGLGVNIVVPGGRQSAFSTIFGAPQVDLRVTGQANINAGFDHRKSDQTFGASLKNSRLDPLFKQDLSLGIVGTIGDKLRVNVSWDTKNQFDYQNQLKLTYEGYDDEIIQRIEAGNVVLQTPSQLIRGGQSLFGIKSEFQLGGVRLQTVASQQEGQANSLNIEGGSQARPFDFKPTDYDEATHFFLGYFFRNVWEDVLSEPPTLQLQNGFSRISHIEVWRLQRVSPGAENVRNAVAVVDLGESDEILRQADGYVERNLPDPTIDQYETAEVESQLRNGEDQTNFLKGKGLEDGDFQVGRFKLLEQGKDYDYDPALGFISLRQRLLEREALAVAYTIETSNGGTVKIGDRLNESGGSAGGLKDQKLVLKLLRPTFLKPPSSDETTGESLNPAAWYLEMRNIYSLNSYGVNQNEFELEINYEPPGRAKLQNLPGMTTTLLEELGLDRVDQQQRAGRDFLFDYINGFTIDQDRGIIIFPYLEPFGSRMRQIIEERGDEALKQDSSRYVFSTLYTQRKENARKDVKLDVYRISGSYKGAVQSFYDLGSFAGLIPGSVRVTSGGTPLAEGSDFHVDYQGGTVQIINPAYLTAGRNINITYEQNQFFNIQKKTLLGARAEYGTEGQPLQLGATLFKLDQKSPVDKFRLGDEPVSNTIWGVDGRLDLDPQWLTRALDALPLLQTRQPSAINLSAEFAQLRPGDAQTFAFQRTRKEMREADRDFYSDELSGVSYLDDFEGFENTFSLRQAGGWTLSAAPADSVTMPGIPPGPDADSLRTHWRGLFGWFTLPPSGTGRDYPVYHIGSAEQVKAQDVYPSKPSLSVSADLISVLDLYFNPHERGPYNYTPDLQGFLEQPKMAWGGVTQALPDGYNDFSLKNIEFVELIISPYAENPQNDAGDGTLYIDLGSISEDVIPNEYINLEDGLSTEAVTQFPDADDWSRLATVDQNTVLDVNDQTRRTEDLGLDGLASYDAAQYDLPGAMLSEQSFFQDFLSRLQQGNADPRYAAEVAKARLDPSGDDFRYFRDDSYYNDEALFPGTATLQQRFSRFYSGTELNSFEAASKLAVDGRSQQGISTYPDTEDLNDNYNADTENSYYEYEIPLSLNKLVELAQPDQVNDYVVERITQGAVDPANPGWFLIRIPIRNATRKVGNIDDFTLIESIRLWTSGHEVPVTVRVASFELVGSQWQTAEEVNEEATPIGGSGKAPQLTIASINSEENQASYVAPVGTVRSQLRTTLGSASGDAREQSMVMRVENLAPGGQQAIYKPYRGENLLKYEHIRMFVHMHGKLAGIPQPLEEIAQSDLETARSKVRFFIRLGSNQSDDYYEYEQPLTPSDPTTGPNPSMATADLIWRTNQMYQGKTIDLNSVNIDLAALNKLKVFRDREIADPLQVFWSDTTDAIARALGVGEFAPPGTRIGVKGNPSLDRVNAIVMGVRAPNGGDELEDVTVWVNELRVSGYDNEGGWAGLLNADVRLADFGTIRANLNAQSDGFGELTSSLGDRDQAALNRWGVTASLNLEKLIPERFGWRLPVSVQVNSSTTTPRYSPQNGDIKLTDIYDVDLPKEEQAQLRRETLEAAQTHAVTRSFTASIQKTDSKSPLLRHTLDGLSLNYSYSDASARNPSTRLNDNWRWSSAATYRLNVRKPRTVRPLWFLDDVPLLGLLGDLRLNYLPQSISASGSASRNFTASQQRLRLNIQTPGQSVVQNPLREQHAFTHRRGLTFQYNPFTFLNLGYDANIDQRLDNIGAWKDSTRATTVHLVPTHLVMSRLFNGAKPHTDQYDQRFSATLQPKLTRIKPLNWITIQPITYAATFGWNAGPEDQLAGAGVQSSLDLKAGVSLKPQDFWKKFGFYKELEEQQKKAEQVKKNERQQREREATQRREAARAEKKRREELKQAALDSSATGTQVLTDADAVGEESVTPDGLPPHANSAVTDTASTGVEEAEGKRGFSLPFSLPKPDPIALLRRGFLAITGVKDFTVSLTSTSRSTSSNVGHLVNDGTDVESYYSLLDALRGRGPSLGYRLGLRQRLGAEERVFNSGDGSLRITDALTGNTRLLARTTISPSQALSVNLNWNTDWGSKENLTYLDAFGRVKAIYGGRNASSTWAFGASPMDVFMRQRSTMSGDLAGDTNGDGVFGDEDGNGRVALSNGSLVEDFRLAYMKSPRWLGSRSLIPIPLPSWQVSYTGISNWPIIRSLAQSANLKHGYSADYGADYESAPDSTTLTYNLGGFPIAFAGPSYNVNSVRVQERYQPLIGIDFSFKGNLSAGVDWNRSNTFSLAPGSGEMSEMRTDQISGSLSYQKQGLSLPFLPGKRLNNRINFSLTMAWDESGDMRYNLKRALADAAGDPAFNDADAFTGDNTNIIADTQRLTIAPKIAYQFSNRVSADFSIKRETFLSKNSLTPSYTSTTGGFNIRVSISN